MNTIRNFELTSINEQIPFCNMIYALAEELTMKNRRCIDWHRRGIDCVTIEFESTGDEYRDLALLTNMLRLSKNAEAHTCAVTNLGTIENLV